MVDHHGPSLAGRFLVSNGLILDLFERELSVPRSGCPGEQPHYELVHLTNTEFKLLYCLMASPDIPHSRMELLRDVWKLDQIIISNRVDAAVHQLRRRVGSNLILSVRRCGYMLGNIDLSSAGARHHRAFPASAFQVSSNSQINPKT